MFARDRVEGPGERHQPEYSPDPIRAGSFDVRSALGVTGQYDTNVFAVEDDEDSDFIVSLQPELNATSTWSRHSLAANVSGTRRQFVDFTDESRTDGRAELRGRLDVTGDVSLGGNVAYARRGETRGQSGLRSEVLEPGYVDTTAGGVFAQYRRDRVMLRVDASFADRKFSDLEVLPPQPILDVGGNPTGGFRASATDSDRSYRDNLETKIAAQVSYAISPDVAFFVRGQYLQREYDNAIGLRQAIALLPNQDPTETDEFTQIDAFDLLGSAGIDLRGTDDFDGPLNKLIGDINDPVTQNAFTQFALEAENLLGVDIIDPNQAFDDFDISLLELDSEQYRTQLGVSFQLPQLVRGEVALGYFNETADSPLFSDTDSFAYDVDLEWLPTQLTSVKFGARSFTEELGVFTTSSSLISEFDVRVDHELRRNILLYARGSFRQEEFKEETQALDENRDFKRFGFGATYKMNRRAHFQLGYDLWTRDSTEDNFDFTKHTVSAGVRLFP